METSHTARKGAPLSARPKTTPKSVPAKPAPKSIVERPATRPHAQSGTAITTGASGKTPAPAIKPKIASKTTPTQSVTPRSARAPPQNKPKTPTATNKDASTVLAKNPSTATDVSTTTTSTDVEEGKVVVPSVTVTLRNDGKVLPPIGGERAATRPRICHRSGGFKTPSPMAGLHKRSKSIDKLDAACAHLGIQTNEPEILNHDLVIGDIKLLLPSKNLVENIDRRRADAKKKELLNSERKYEAHSEREAEHLTDLKEFLEKAVITKRTRKPREALQMDRKLINHMDEILKRDVPKAESITNIRGRIQQKEKELLTLFDKVENLKIPSNPTN